MVVNASNLNVTHCNASQATCISAPQLIIVALTASFSTFVNNSGRYGLYRPIAFAGQNWFVLSGNFFNISGGNGILFTMGYGMIIDNCRFSGNTADIGSLPDTYVTYITVNSFFSENIPTGTRVNASNCRSWATDSMLPITTRLCPTYSASRPRYPIPSQSNYFGLSVNLGSSNSFQRSEWVGATLHLRLSVGLAASNRTPLSKPFVQSRPFPSGELRLSFGIGSCTLLVHPQQFDSNCPKETYQCDSPLLIPTAFEVTAPLIAVSAFPPAATTFVDQSISDRNPPIGLIVGVVIGAVTIVGAIVIGLAFLRTRRRTPQDSEEQTSVLDLQFCADTATTTTDETLVSYHDSCTYEGSSSATDSRSVPWNGPGIVNVTLL
jgi:hypothetical protein